MSRSPFLAAIAPTAALVAGLARWLLQGSGNLYTTTERRAYVPDLDLGWRVVDGGPPWLGLEVLGVVLGVLGAVIVGAWLLRRHERTRGTRPGLRSALWTLGALPLAVPAWAFAGGFGPADARDTLPSGQAEVASVGITAGLDAPAGRWTVVAHEGTAITARVSAGGEAFDARFAGDVRGAWLGDPRDLGSPMTAEVSVATASVDTGVEMRTEHARNDYLQSSRFPRLGFRLDRILAAESRGDGRIGFRAAGSLEVVGSAQAVDITGEMRLLDDAARARLGLGNAVAMIVEADTHLRISDTPLAADAGDFDGNEIPIHASLVLVHQATTGSIQ